MEAIDYGIIRLALTPMRRHPNHLSEQVSQVLFGEHYEVLYFSQSNAWIYIRMYTDKYEGWIDVKQHYSISFDYFNHVSQMDYKITIDQTTTILYKKTLLTILMGSIIPISTLEIFKMEEQFAFNGESKSIQQRRGFDFLKTTALRYLNTPYEWGGRNPFGVDCSGFVQMVFKICGYNIPRDSSQQVTKGQDVKTADCSKPGDLAFFFEANDSISHVGIILNKKEIIHASGKVKIDTWSQKGIIDKETKKQTHVLVHIKRILGTSIN